MTPTSIPAAQVPRPQRSGTTMSPEEVIQKLNSVLHPKYPEITFNPSGICSRTLHIPFKDKSGLHYTLTLFVEVTMAPTTGIATGIKVTHPPSHSWEATIEDLGNSNKSQDMLFDLISDLGQESINRERQTLKVFNNRDLGLQLAKFCHANGNQQVSENSDQFSIKNGQMQLKIQITENKTSDPHASVQISVAGVDNTILLNSLKMLIQKNNT